jgi:hypothetical protein
MPKDRGFAAPVPRTRLRCCQHGCSSQRVGSARGCIARLGWPRTPRQSTGTGANRPPPSEGTRGTLGAREGLKSPARPDGLRPRRRLGSRCLALRGIDNGLSRRLGPLRWPRSRISDFSGSVGAWCRSCHTDPELLQSVEKGLRGCQIGRLEPFGEPVVDRLKERQRLRGTALIA